MKICGIDVQKWTLAFIWYAHVWHAYNMQFSCAYDTTFFGVHMKRSFHVHMICIYPTTLIYTPKSIFAYQYHEFLFLFAVLSIRTFMRSVWLFTAWENGRVAWVWEGVKSVNWVIFTKNAWELAALHCKSVFTSSKCICLTCVPHCPAKSHLLSRNRSIARWSP